MNELLPQISKVTTDEVDFLRAISVQTFTETFAHQNSEVDMQKYILEKLSVEKLNSEINSKGSAFYFLKSHNQIIGYLKLNTGESQTELKNNISLEIERIYVLQEFHGKQCGQILLNKAIEIAKELQYQYIWLAVWEHNVKAIAFYNKNGFIEFDKHTFQLGNDVQLDLMMKLELN
jgi:ribosomal protein S18 acetylase RimI-like enzyme